MSSMQIFNMQCRLESSARRFAQIRMRVRILGHTRGSFKVAVNRRTSSREDVSVDVIRGEPGGRLSQGLEYRSPGQRHCPAVCPCSQIHMTGRMLSICHEDADTYCVQPAGCRS